MTEHTHNEEEVVLALEDEDTQENKILVADEEVQDEPTLRQKHRGRPTLYSEEVVERTWDYIEMCNDSVEQEMIGISAKGTELYKNKLAVRIPTVEGLASYLGINKDTVYQWCKDHAEYSVIIDTLRSLQADRLLNKGLSGDYNSTFVKLMLVKHGYRDAQEVTGGGGKDLFNGLTDEDKEKLRALATPTPVPLAPSKEAFDKAYEEVFKDPQPQNYTHL